ncbi:MAG: AraC family transcriptional regulator [Treponema sp.]|nr:AraC family transcriptional regulator [Treponema sp.]
MDWVRTVNNAIEFMENHLTENITLVDISKNVNISAYHFQQAFTLLAGITPSDYLRKRRLSQAGSEIAAGERVIDIALKYCYETPESFTKAFTRFHGFSPIQVRKGSAVKFMNRFSVQIKIDGGCIMEYKIEKWEAMELLVHTKEFHCETSDKEIPKFWDEYYANEELRKVPGYLGVCAQQKSDSDVFKYGIGCKASDVSGVPAGFEILHIPEYTWAVFKCVGPAGPAIQSTWDKIYREWLPVADYEQLHDYDIENYLPGDPAAADYVSEICIPVRKK